MLPFRTNTFARFLATIVATFTKGALPCRKETQKSVNGFVSETATMARTIKNLAGHRFLFKNCLPHTYFTNIFSQMHTHKMYRSCYFEIYFLIIIFDILKIS